MLNVNVLFASVYPMVGYTAKFLGNNMSTKYKGATPEQVSEFMSELADVANLSSLPPEALSAIRRDMPRFGAFFEWMFYSYETIDLSLLSHVIGSTKRSTPHRYTPMAQKQYLDREREKGRLCFRERVELNPMIHVSRNNFNLLLMDSSYAKRGISHEFAIRNLKPASGFEVITLLDSLRHSKKSDYPFVSMTDSIVAYLYAGDKDGPIVVRPIDTRQDIRQMNWSYIGTM